MTNIKEIPEPYIYIEERDNKSKVGVCKNGL